MVGSSHYHHKALCNGFYVLNCIDNFLKLELWLLELPLVLLDQLMLLFELEEDYRFEVSFAAKVSLIQNSGKTLSLNKAPKILLDLTLHIHASFQIGQRLLNN